MEIINPTRSRVWRGGKTIISCLEGSESSSNLTVLIPANTTSHQLNLNVLHQPRTKEKKKKKENWLPTTDLAFLFSVERAGIVDLLVIYWIHQQNNKFYALVISYKCTQARG